MKTTSIILALVWIGVVTTPAQLAVTNATWHYVSATTNLTGDSKGDFPDLAVPEPAVMPEPPTVYAPKGPTGFELGVAAPQMVTAEIRLLADGAVGDYGLQKVCFPADITEAPVTIITPDGRKLSCRPTFLALHDTASGQSLVLGQVQKSIGELADGNTVVYPNAFDTISAGIRYRYTAHSLEQDLLLYDQIPLPKEFQAEQVRLESWTAWLDSPPDTKVAQAIDLRPLAARGLQAGAAATDEQLQFGAMRIADGYAFGIQSEGDKSPVAKSFVRIEGMDWLIESVDYTALKPMLDKLPKSHASLTPDKIQSDRGQLVRSLLARSEPKSSSQPRRMAKTKSATKDSVVLDFVIVSGVPVPSGAVSWWPGGGNALDALGTNNGTLQGNVGYTVGKVGQGFNSDGNQDGVTVGNPTHLRLQDFTIEAWIRRASTSVVSYGSYGNGILFGYGYAGYGLYLDPTGKLALSKIGINGVVSSAAITNTSYHHVAVTKTGSTVVFYLDGVAYAVGDYNPGFTFATAAAIGFRADNLDNSFYGAIDEPAVYNRALSAEEVQSIYDAGAAGKINPRCVTAPPNLVGWWAGDGHPYDLARTNVGTLVNNATYQSAVVSEGFSFNGTGGHVRGPDQASFHCTTGLTIEAWVHPTNVAAQNEIVDKWDAVVGYNQRSYAAALLSGGRFFLQLAPLGTTAGATYVATTNAVALNGWTHLAGTYDGSMIRVYLNGVLNAQGAYTNGIFPGTNDLAIGGVVGGAAYGSVILPFKGWIDEPSLYNRALTSTEITALYTAGSAGKCKVDTDGDGLTDLQEAFLGTNPNLADTDGDGMDDGWEWDHFGSFSRDGAGNYDDDYLTDLEEYNAGSDPNSILFDVSFANLRVNANTATGTFAILNGVPNKMAVLLDSTNFATATWLPYSANLSVNLGSTNGSHQVWIGLKGRASTSDATWSAWPLTRDTAAPIIVITNPVGTTTSRPILQLQGYSPEPLFSLRYDVTNAAGSLSNAEGYVTQQWFDTNLFELTTNWFECVDIGLTNGTNRVTLRATDLAGNVRTNVYSCVLDYAGDTSAPALTVYWPQNGAQISGDSFTLRGWLDDATASVTAQIVDANNVTNVVSGLLERDGLLWLADLPLGAGTNMLTLTMTDAAGNTSATNLSVVQSTVQLVLDDLTSVDLNQPRITVSGTINVSDHKIWVNGVEVTNASGWDWWVEGVPVNPGGTAVIQAVAIPTTDNGGNGTGGSGGSGATVQNPGNPISPNAKTVEGAPDKQHEVVMTQYYKDWTFAAAELDEFPVTHHETLKAKWKLAQPGYGFWDVCWGAPYEDVMDYEWWHGIWDEFQLGVQWSGQAGGSESEVCGVRDYHSDEYPYAAPTLWPGESCHGWAPRMVSDTFRASLQTVSREAQTLYELHTGGKRAVNGRKNLFVLSAGAEGHTELFYPEIAAYSVSKPITSTAIALGALGKLGSDGRLYKALGAGETHPITPTVAGSRYYTFGQPGASKHRLVHLTQCTALSNPDNARTSLGVGEYVNFAFEPPVDMTFPETPWWIATAGSIDPATGSGTMFTAPSNAANAMVRVFVRDTQLDTFFSVKEPTGVDQARTYKVSDMPFDGGVSAAGMKLRVYLAPTTVSFCRLECIEVGVNVMNLEGYYADNSRIPLPLYQLRHQGADTPFAIFPDNSWEHDNGLERDWDKCWRENTHVPPMLYHGKFKWYIPLKWKIPGSTADWKLIENYYQEFEVTDNGEMTVKKFGKQVTRGMWE